jgi:toxin ParE1/3/4
VATSYRLSVRAASDLLEIYSFTEEKFGAYQADAYHAGLERTFGLLADFPLMGSSADEVVAGCRRFRFQSHNIFYSEASGYLLIRAIIHASQDIRPNLFN